MTKKKKKTSLILNILMYIDEDRLHTAQLVLSLWIDRILGLGRSLFGWTFAGVLGRFGWSTDQCADLRGCRRFGRAGRAFEETHFDLIYV